MCKPFMRCCKKLFATLFVRYRHPQDARQGFGVTTYNYSLHINTKTATYPDKGVATILEGLRNGLGENTTSNCTVRPDYDYEQPDSVSQTTYDADECCSLCYEVDYCNYWTFFDSKCYLVPLSFSFSTLPPHPPQKTPSVANRKQQTTVEEQPQVSPVATVSPNHRIKTPESTGAPDVAM